MQTHHGRPGLALSLPLHSLGTSGPAHPGSISPATSPVLLPLTWVRVRIPDLEWLPSLAITQQAAPGMLTLPASLALPS